jgi:hypothetical protein
MSIKFKNKSLPTKQVCAEPLSELTVLEEYHALKKDFIEGGAVGIFDESELKEIQGWITALWEKMSASDKLGVKEEDKSS